MMKTVGRVAPVQAMRIIFVIAGLLLLGRDWTTRSSGCFRFPLGLCLASLGLGFWRRFLGFWFCLLDGFLFWQFRLHLVDVRSNLCRQCCHSTILCRQISRQSMIHLAAEDL